MSYKTDWDKIGYDLEELYFEKLNRELINNLKAKKNEEESFSKPQEEPMGVVIPFRPRNKTPSVQNFDPSSEKKVA